MYQNQDLNSTGKEGCKIFAFTGGYGKKFFKPDLNCLRGNLPPEKSSSNLISIVVLQNFPPAKNFGKKRSNTTNNAPRSSAIATKNILRWIKQYQHYHTSKNFNHIWQHDATAPPQQVSGVSHDRSFPLTTASTRTLVNVSLSFLPGRTISTGGGLALG